MLYGLFIFYPWLSRHALRYKNIIYLRRAASVSCRVAPLRLCVETLCSHPTAVSSRILSYTDEYNEYFFVMTYCVYD